MRKATSLTEKDWEWARPLQGMFSSELKGDKGVDPAVEYARVDRPKYIAEIGKRGGDYLYHFFKKEEGFPKGFSDKLGDAFLAVFLLKERLSWAREQLVTCTATLQGRDGPYSCPFKGQPQDTQQVPGDNRPHCPDCGSTQLVLALDSWSVRAQGFADNPMADELAVRIFDTLDKLLT